MLHLLSLSWVSLGNRKNPEIGIATGFEPGAPKSYLCYHFQASIINVRLETESPDIVLTNLTDSK